MKAVKSLMYPLAILSAIAVLVSCKAYSFTGGALKPGVETVSIETFDNSARIVNPTLTQDLTESLKDRFVRQTNLRLQNFEGDMQISGSVTQYDVAPVAIQGNETAAANRLSISMKIKYVNAKYPEDNWENTFSSFEDFGAEQALSDVEATLTAAIVDRLTQDIFNKCLSNW